MSFGIVKVILEGIPNKSMIFLPIERPISHILFENISRKPKSPVRISNIAGDSVSKPNPANIAFIDWKTQLPIRSPQPTATKTAYKSATTGTLLSNKVRSVLIIPSKALAQYDIRSKNKPYIHCTSPCKIPSRIRHHPPFGICCLRQHIVSIK